MMFSILVRAALEGAFVVAVVWIVSRTWRPLSPSVQTMLWWCAAVKFLVASIWIVPVTLPLLPVRDVAMPRQVATAAQPVTGQSAIERVGPAESGLRRRIDGTSALLISWAIGCLAATGITVRRWRQTHAVIREKMEVLGRKMEDASNKAEEEMQELLERLIGSGAATPVK